MSLSHRLAKKNSRKDSRTESGTENWVHQLISPRTPILLDPKLLSIFHLPDELLLLIISFVDDVILRTLAAVSSKLYCIVRGIQYREITLDLGQQNHTRYLLDSLTIDLRLSDVHILTVKDNGGSAKVDDVLLAFICSAALKMTALHDLHWQCFVPIPLSLLQYNPSHTRIHANIDAIDFLGPNREQARDCFSRFFDSPNLISLQAYIIFYDESQWCLAMQALKRVLCSCPRLVRIPRLYIEPPSPHSWELRDGAIPGTTYFGLGLSGGEKPQPLEELGMQSFFLYDGNRVKTSSLVHQDDSQFGVPRTGTELRYWARTFDWSRLRKLNNISEDLAKEIAPKLTNLREVNFLYSKGMTTYPLRKIPSTLEILRLSSWSQFSKDLSSILRHGRTLRYLGIYSPHGWYGCRVSQLAQALHLSVLATGLSCLVSLTVDLRRDTKRNAWPYRSLDAIARFPMLRHLHLCFKAGNGQPGIDTPHLTVSEARKLYDYVRSKSSTIQFLELRAGCGGKIGAETWPSLESQNSVYLKCQVSLSEGDAANGFVMVTCPDLSYEMNAELTRMSQAERIEGGSATTSVGLSLEVAVSGPFTCLEWLAWKEGIARKS
ncbi:hypothetical protein VTL71DRAFT_6400 [Oculimacula yallundae]|uniref:F-box domain-containing protein n=1 Tax=Oculimacula yallundae TaxID=86028 RepID=A0ABR4BYK0_9HELO